MKIMHDSIRVVNYSSLLSFSLHSLGFPPIILCLSLSLYSLFSHLFFFPLSKSALSSKHAPHHSLSPLPLSLCLWSSLPRFPFHPFPSSFSCSSFPTITGRPGRAPSTKFNIRLIRPGVRLVTPGNKFTPNSGPKLAVLPTLMRFGGTAVTWWGRRRGKGKIKGTR